jgi:hypothetical protein
MSPVGEVLWHVTMSLEGFIAGSGDATSWVVDHSASREPLPDAWPT